MCYNNRPHETTRSQMFYPVVVVVSTVIVFCVLVLQIAKKCIRNQLFAVGGKIPDVYTKYQFGGVIGLAYGSGGNSTSLFLNMIKQFRIDPYFALYLSS